MNQNLPKSRIAVLTMIWPLLGAVVLFLLGIIIVLVLPRRLQVSLISDWLLTVLVLCPMVICMFPLVIGIIALIAGMNQLHQTTAKPLRRLSALSQTMADRTVQTTTVINEKTVDASSRFAFLERLLSVFDEPSSSVNGTEQKEEKPHE